MKRELQTLYIKHDSQFKTLSKIALSQLILKIVYLKNNGTSLHHINTELEQVLSSPVSQKDIEESIRVLLKAKKLHTKSNRYFIHNDYKEELSKEIVNSKALLDKTIIKYFSQAESKREYIKNWFNETIVSFFEKYSFEWFHQISYKGRSCSNVVPNMQESLDSVLLNNTCISEKDKEWLKVQFIKFIDSEDTDDNLLFWYYGISMFSSRLITARNYADGITVEMFRDSKFILDTNILMILDLEEHELSKALESLENIFIQLNIKPFYLFTTRDEYLRAMDWRRTETIRVFDNFPQTVLKASDCPFIKTAVKRGCSTGEDVKRMFDKLMDLPSVFHNSLCIETYDYAELSDAIEIAEDDPELKSKLNETYKKRTGRDKREKPIKHDAGIIGGTQFIRKSEKSDKCWIITSDSTMKRFAIEHCIRDENEIAVGLDVVLGLMAVNSGGVIIDASNFAPLFKNLIKYSLMPESDAFEVKDLAFILRTNIKINELPNEKVIEVAKQVKRLRVAGEDEENIALYLRRFIEGDTIGMVKEMESALSKESIAKIKREEAERERDIAFDVIRNKRGGELRDEYDKKLLINRLLFIGILTGIAVLIFYALKHFIQDQSPLSQFIVAIIIELIFALLPFLPINKRLMRKHSEYVNDINRKVENEIIELKKKTK